MITLQSLVEQLTSETDSKRKYDPDSLDMINYPKALPHGEQESPETFTPWLKSIFKTWSDDVQRIGINGSTLYHSIFYCIDPKFEKLTSEQQIKYFYNIRFLLCKELLKIDKTNNNMFYAFGYKKLKWKKNNLIALIKSGDATMEIFRFFADYFSINIIIVDNDDQQIQIHYNDEPKFCPFMETVILIRTQTGFDPIISVDKDKRTWNYNDDFFRQFLKKHSKLFMCPTYYQDPKEEPTRPFVMSKVREKKETVEMTLKNINSQYMRLCVLQAYASKLKIPIKMGKKFKTKVMLTEEIQKKLIEQEAES